MDNYSLYLKIQGFKSSRSALVDGINYANVVATLLYDRTWKGWLRRVAYSLFMGVSSFGPRKMGSTHVLMYASRDKRRLDYDYIVDRLAGELDGRGRLVEVRDQFSFIQPFRTLMGIRSTWNLSRGFEVSFARRLSCALLISRMRSALLPLLEEVLGDATTLVTFCDAQPAENLATQAGCRRGMFTVTNQHGQYRVLDQTNMSADAEAYANFQSDRMLAWGPATVAEFAKAGVSPSRMFITGWIRRSAPVGRPRAREPRRFGVMLNGENARASNLNLLQAANILASRLGIGFIVRLHPWSRKAMYANAAGAYCESLEHVSLERYLERVSFSLAHMSGAVVEVLAQDEPVYLLDDGSLASAFRVEGLSWPDAIAIAGAVERDRADMGAMRQRISALGRWFNESDRQAERIAEAIEKDKHKIPA